MSSPDRIPLPPQADVLRDFPVWRAPAGTRVWRVHREGRGPWNFNNGGRFGLRFPDGTCYVAYDPITAVSETVIRGQRVLLVDDLLVRRIRRLHLPEDVSAADFMSRLAAGFGVTRDFGTETPYDRTQSWAQTLFEVPFRGIRYWARHDLSADAASLAVFGASGERKRWKRGRAESLGSHRWVRRITEETGCQILSPPDDDDLTFTSLV